MSEVWFYQLDRELPETVLPTLLLRGLERGMRMSVESTQRERLTDLSSRLWAYEDVAFIPHGLAGEEGDSTQPICLCATAENPNASAFRFYVDGAVPQDVSALTRASILFAGADEASITTARSLWKQFKAEGHAVRYWKQDETGRWQDMTA